MKKNILLIYFPIGPTFRERVVYNIVNNKKDYSYYDILIMTDIKEDPIFDQLSEFNNINIVDIDKLRKDYQWSVEHEPLPIKTYNQSDYANYIMGKYGNENLISSAIWRFAFLLPNIKNYDSIVVCNCDIVCANHEENYNMLVNDLTNYENDIAIGDGGMDFTDKYITTAKIIEKDLDITLKKERLISNDGNLFCYSFKDKNKIEQFFNVYNKIVYEILVNKNPNYQILGKHTLWMLHNEEICSIIYSLLDIDCLPKTHYMRYSYSIHYYPEDRFWNWTMENFETSNISKQDFIEKNYEKLKNFYNLRGQYFNY
jgi:hypothetical protein